MVEHTACCPPSFLMRPGGWSTGFCRHPTCWCHQDQDATLPWKIQKCDGSDVPHTAQARHAGLLQGSGSKNVAQNPHGCYGVDRLRADDARHGHQMTRGARFWAANIMGSDSLCLELHSIWIFIKFDQNILVFTECSRLSRLIQSFRDDRVSTNGNVSLSWNTLLVKLTLLEVKIFAVMIYLVQRYWSRIQYCSELFKILDVISTLYEKCKFISNYVNMWSTLFAI